MLSLWELKYSSQKQFLYTLSSCDWRERVTFCTCLCLLEGRWFSEYILSLTPSHNVVQKPHLISLKSEITVSASVHD